MLQVISAYRLPELEAALSRAAHRHGAAIVAVTRFGHLMDKGSAAAREAIAFVVSHQRLYGELMSADVRFATFLPCRIAAFEQDGALSLTAMSPVAFCRTIGRGDLEAAVAPLEALLNNIMDSLSRREPAQAHVASSPSGLGATEMQMNSQGTVPQRIGGRGVKVEDLAGVGGHDSSGG